MPGRLDFEVGFSRTGGPRDDSEPMRLMVLGDFSGTPPAERTPLATRPIHRVDVDNIDDLMKRLRPRVALPAGEIQFDDIDGFHPDRLYARLDQFQRLRQARTSQPPANEELLGRLLGKPSAPNPAPAAPAASGLDALVRDVVAPHIVTDTSAITRPYLAAVDATIAEEMRTLLHAPAFQSLEAAWRGVRWLVSNLELDEQLQLHLVDVARDEVLGDIVAERGQIAQTSLYQKLADRGPHVPDARRWSALVGLFEFGPSPTDIGLLAALGLIASHAGGPLLAGADLALAGGDAPAPTAWQALRRSEAAPWIGLAAPRVLLRLPYGKSSDPVEAFAFEEFDGAPVQDELLWGNGALAVALLIGKAFTARGWDMEPGDEREIGDLPAYTFIRDGERELQPCAERVLVEREIEPLLKAGLMPIVSRRDRTAVVVVRFQSISDPPAALAW
jgi:type VI secretion system protein ImpC